MAKRKQKNQSLYDTVIALECNLPLERQRLIDLDQDHKKRRAAQVKKIAAIEQELASSRDALLQDFFQNQIGAYGIQAVYAQLGLPIPDGQAGLCDEPSQSEEAQEEK